MATPEVLWVNEVSIDEEVKDLKDEVLENQDDEVELEKDWKKEEKKEEKKEKSFTFKPIAVSLWWSRINNWGEWWNNITTNVEFAWWWKNLSLYGYARKDWNKFAKWFNEGIEIFTTESLKLGKGFDLNSKQFYWWKWTGEILVWPQISGKKQIWNTEIWAALGGFWTYDVIPSQKDRISWTWTVSINFSVKQKNWKTRNWDAFLNLNWQDFKFNNYGTYWEANLETPNFLDPKVAWQLCWIIQARYWWNVKEIELKYLWVWLKYKF